MSSFGKRVVFFVFTFFACTAVSAQPRSRTSFNKDWKFFLGDAARAKEASFDDSRWRVLNLPHDWSIEGSFDEKNPAKPEGGGLPTGIAWYRKTFAVPASSSSKNIVIEFDGIYRDSEVWVNGKYLGKRPNGYISFAYDITSCLKFGQPNTIAVRVDNSLQPNSRWYSGSGIYRNVWLTTTSNVAVDHWGTFITTPEVSQASATVNLAVKLKNTGSNSGSVKVNSIVYGPNGAKIAEVVSSGVSLKDKVISLTQTLRVKEPKLWSTDNPHQYKAVTRVYTGKKLLDEYVTSFGIRYFKFDAATGFSLNGKSLKILGVCNHHDLGALGAAFNTRAAERQLEILKEMGCNAIRTAHNPPAPELLDLCDKMGFLVMDESFDMWRKKKTSQDYHKDFPEWHKADLEDMVKRDRNHPSIILWSIGNEIREQFDSTGIAITRDLVRIVKNLDTSRPVMSALTETVAEKNFMYQAGVLDLYGLNYNHKLYKDFPKNYPGQKFLATETTSALQTRGFYDTPPDTIRRWPRNGKTKLTEGNSEIAVSSYDNVSAYWGSTHEETWKEVKKYPHVSGLFVWTGFDYLGEPIPYPWPARSSYFGIIDLAGFPKNAYYMYKSEWTNTPVLHLLPHWNWTAGKSVDVWAYYNNADEVELFLNGRSLGSKKKEGEDLHVEWKVNYEPGILKAISRKNGKVILTREVKTAGAPSKIELSADRNTIQADGKDLSFITVRILDAEGNLVPDADNLVKFNMTGNGFIAGVDNGYQASMESFKTPYRKAFKGMCLAIIQSKEKSGEINLQASSEGLQPMSITIKSK
ncbi:beta-galactosidase GalB [Pedobacter sp. P351]|uniref:beta-galactosidase GalB n=1 Tax=Pedobacter superstes TaxID=3133441 RepID=UPI0030AD8E29